MLILSVFLVNSKVFNATDIQLFSRMNDPNFFSHSSVHASSKSVIICLIYKLAINKDVSFM